MAVASEVNLAIRESGKKWEYGELTVKMVGEDEPSNTVMAVL